MHISPFTKEHGLRRPSIDYYAFRHLSFEDFQALQIIYALFNQLMSLPTCSDDISVVRHKTQFWLSELQAAYTGTPVHPLTNDLKNLLKSVQLDQKDWLGIVTAVEMRTDQLLLENAEEIRLFGDRLYGGMYRMIAAVLGGGTDPALATARILLHLLQDPNHLGLTVNLPDTAQITAYTLFGEAAQNCSSKPMRVLAGLYQYQAKQPMVHLGPLKLLGLSIRERLSSRA